MINPNVQTYIDYVINEIVRSHRDFIEDANSLLNILFYILRIRKERNAHSLIDLLKDERDNVKQILKLDLQLRDPQELTDIINYAFNEIANLIETTPERQRQTPKKAVKRVITFRTILTTTKTEYFNTDQWEREQAEREINAEKQRLLNQLIRFDRK